MTTPLQAQAQQALVDRLKLEAQMHAQEARTANATIAEIYQLLTGATGEPGNWNGAEPVRAFIAAKEAEVGRLRAAGALLSNCAFNLSQAAGRVLSERDANSLKLAQLQWDAALTQGETK